MTRNGWWAALVMMAAVGAGSAGAQGPMPVPPVNDTIAPRPEPAVMDTTRESGAPLRRFGGPVAVTRAAAAAPVSRGALVPGPSRSQARAMMIVGAAGLVAGAVIDDDAGQLIMIGSAIVGLYGLYHFLQ
jgi:hypothetical protein